MREPWQTNSRDLPFALIYMLDPGNGRAWLAACAGIDADHPGVKAELSLAGSDTVAARTRSCNRSSLLVIDLAERFSGVFPAGGWRQPPRVAIVAADRLERRARAWPVF